MPLGRVKKASRSRKPAASCRVRECSGVIDDRAHRLVVIQSSSLETRKAQALLHTIDKEREAILAQVGTWFKKPFPCQEDAEASAAAFATKAPRFWDTKTEIRTQESFYTKVMTDRGFCAWCRAGRLGSTTCHCWFPYHPTPDGTRCCLIVFRWPARPCSLPQPVS